MPAKKRAKALKSEAPAHRPESVLATYPTPAGCAGSSLQPCERCGAKWSARDREEIDGQAVPVYHRTFLIEDVQLPVYSFVFDFKRNKVVGDIWPVLPEIRRRWVCLICWHHIWEIGLGEWCREQRESADTSESGRQFITMEDTGARVYGCELLPESDEALQREIAQHIPGVLSLRADGPALAPANLPAVIGNEVGR